MTASGSCSAAEQAPARLEAADRLRLEVTISAGQEIYSWPGATRFDSRDVSEIIREGPIATGSFGAHLLAVFDNPRVEFHFAGERSEAGRRLLEYRFAVPLAASRYRVRSGGFSETIAYEGSFLLDPATLDLLRLTFRRLDTLQGDSGPVPPFWKVPLFGEYSAGDGYRDLFRAPQAQSAGCAPAGAAPDSTSRGCESQYAWAMPVAAFVTPGRFRTLPKT